MNCDELCLIVMNCNELWWTLMSCDELWWTFLRRIWFIWFHQVFIEFSWKLLPKESQKLMSGGIVFSHFSRPVLLCWFYVEFGSLLAPFGPFGLPLAPFWLHLARFWLPFGAPGLTFAHPCAQFSHLGGPLASFFIFVCIFDWNRMQNLIIWRYPLKSRLLIKQIAYSLRHGILSSIRIISKAEASCPPRAFR